MLDTNIINARRLGKKGKLLTVEVEDTDGTLSMKKVQCPRRMQVTCTPHFKSSLLAKKKDLGGQIDPKGFTYFVASYLTDPLKANFEKNKAVYGPYHSS